MLISEDIKLDYSDVLIRPKRSTLTSRYDVDMTRTHKFVHSKKEWNGVPIMASNMDTVGTPAMHSILLKHKMITCPAKHYLKTNITTFNSGNDNLWGYPGNDKISGGSGNDILNGGNGNDLLVGGKGKDKLIGGKGKDIFKLSTGYGYDLIQDFKNNQDKIFIGSIKKLKLKNRGKNVCIYNGKDLLAKVKGSKGDLSKKGNYLV